MPRRVLIFDAHADAYRALLAPKFPALDIAATASPETAVALAAEAEALFFRAPFIFPELIERTPHLAWIQALTTGTDDIFARSRTCRRACSSPRRAACTAR